MKKLLLGASLFFFSCVALAEPSDVAHAEPLNVAQTPQLSHVPSETERAERRERLARERQRLEDQYKQDIKLCYQNFDVTSCRLKARDRRIEANNLLRKDELQFNASERLIQTEDAKRSMAERTSEAARKEAETARVAAIAASKERADMNAQKQIDHALQGSKRGDYEQKQREAAERRTDVERKLRERNKEPAAPLPVPSR